MCFGPGGGGDEETWSGGTAVDPWLGPGRCGAVHGDEPAVAILGGPVADSGEDEPAWLQLHPEQAQVNLLNLQLASALSTEAPFTAASAGPAASYRQLS